MRNIRKLIASISMVAILSTLVVSTTAFAGTFSDVEPSDYYYESVETMVANGAMPSDIVEEGVYHPGDDLTRGLAAGFVVLAVSYPLENPASATFVDVPVGSYYYQWVETAVSNAIVNGYAHLPGYYGPADTLTRAQYAKMTVLGFDLPEYIPAEPTFPDVSPDAWYYPFVETAYHYSVLNGRPNGLFDPDGNINRADGAVITHQAMNPVERDEPVDPDEPDDPDNPPVVTDGDLVVEVSASNPAGDTVPDGATSVKVAAWDFTAGEGGATLESLEVHTFGVTSLPSDHSLYLYKGSDRLTSGKSVNSTTNLATFNNINEEIAAGETLTLTLKLDTGTVATSTEASFEIEGAVNVDAGDSEVSGDFPLQGETFTLSTVDAGTVTVEKNGTITNPKVGEDDVTVAKFKIGAATEAASLEEVGLLVTGTISNDAIVNFELYVSGVDEPIATTDSLNSKDLAVFVLDEPYLIAKGETKSFTVKADFDTGRSGDTVKIYVDETTDILAIGDKYGFGMTVVIGPSATTSGSYDASTNACTASTGDCSYSALQGGDITVTSNGPAADSVGIGEDDVHLMDFSVVSVSDITVKNWPIYLLTGSADAADNKGLLDTSGVANFTDIKVMNVDTGETLMGPIDADALFSSAYATAITDNGTTSTDGDGYYLLSDEFDMEPGEELNLALTVDVRNTTNIDSETIYGAIQLGGTYPEIRDTNNKVVTNSTSLVPASQITGKTMTVASPSLALSLAAVPASKTYVKGAQNVQFTGFSAKCGAGGDCKVTDVLLQGYIDDDNADDWAITGTGATNSTTLNSVVGSVWLEDSEGNEVAAAQSVESDGDVQFEDVNWTIDAGTTEIFYAVGNISSDAYKDDDAENVAFGIATAGDVDYQDEDGNSRDSTGTPNSEGTGATDPSTFVTISDGGSLTVAVDGGTANENIVVAGTSDVEISKFKFTTTDEPFTVKKLSINNRQSAVTDATTLGDYDDNVQSIKISYTNGDGDTETKSGYLTNGTADFGDMDFFIDENDDATLTLYATMNTVSGGADVGTYVDLNLAFNDFEATGGSSGETYTAAKLDSAVSADSDLDIGSQDTASATPVQTDHSYSGFTWTNSGYETNAALTVTAPGTSVTATVDTGTQFFPVGTLFIGNIDEDGTYDYDTDAVFVLTSSHTATSMTFTVINDNDAALPVDIELWYALPGSGYLTNAKQMHLYKSKPTLALSAGSPSGSRTQSPTDEIFEFTVAADSGEDLIIRQGLAGDDENVGFGMDANGTDDFTITTTSGEFVDGAGGFLWTTTADSITDNDCFVPNESYTAGTGAGQFGSNKYMSFWIKSDQADTPYNDFSVIVDATTPANGSCTPAVAGDELRLTTTNSVWVNGTAMSSDTAVIGGGTANVWDLVTVDISGTTNIATAIAGGFMVDATGGLTVANGDLVYIDGITFHNEMLTVDLAGNAVFDTTPSSIVDCTLKDGSTVIASVAAGVRTTSDAKVLIVPENNVSGTDYGDIEITKGTTETFSLVCDTQALITQSVNDDLLTPSIDYGSSSDGTVTRGDFWWSADETTKTLVYWLGDVGTELAGSTLRY